MLVCMHACMYTHEPECKRQEASVVIREQLVRDNSLLPLVEWGLNSSIKIGSCNEFLSHCHSIQTSLALKLLYPYFSIHSAKIIGRCYRAWLRLRGVPKEDGKQRLE